MKKEEGEGQSTILQRRVLALVGGYGAGKTQVAINLALRWAQQGSRVALIDIDLINPYFRSRELAEYLGNQGVEVIRPAGDLAYSENPALGPEIDRALQDRHCKVILDVGGDEAGATILGRYQPFFQATADAALIQIINVFRPFSTTVSEIEQLRWEIERKSRNRVAGWINNSNLQSWTSIEEWRQAEKIIQDLVQNSGIPLVGTAVNPAWAQTVGLGWDPDWITLERFLNLRWKNRSYE